MTVDKYNIFLTLKEDINDLIDEQSLDEELSIELMNTISIMERDCSMDTLKEQSSKLQSLIDGLVNDNGLTASLTVVQGRIMQLNIIFDIRDTFN